MPWGYMDAGATGIIEINLVPSMGTVFGFSLDAGVQSGMVVKTLWCPFPEAWYNGTISVISKVMLVILTFNLIMFGLRLNPHK